MFNLNNINICDAPKPWGLYFQDTASPQMEALVELHDNIMFYLVIILFGVAWILLSVIRNYVYSRSPISNKYLNHGTNVPNNNKHTPFIPINRKNIKSNLKIRFYSTFPVRNLNIVPVKFYSNMLTMKNIIYRENKNKSGIYMLTNIITGNIYIGQSTNLYSRLSRYYSKSYLKNKGTFIISKALVKYGYTNFSLSILEYCDKDLLFTREQYYLDQLSPVYNILKLAGSSLSYKHTKESKNKISKALKGIYIGEKSPLFGRTHTDKVKENMSIARKGVNNAMFGKKHKEISKEIMRQKAKGRKFSIETRNKMSMAL